MDVSPRWLGQPAVLGLASAALLAVSALFPGIGVVAALAAPMPVAVAAFRHGRFGVIAAMVASLLVLPLGGLSAFALAFVLMAGFGILPGAALRHGRGTRQTIMAMTAAAALGVVVLTAVSMAGSGQIVSLGGVAHYLASIPHTYLQSIRSGLVQSYRSEGLTSAQAQRLAGNQMLSVSVVVTEAWPFLLLFSMTVLAAVSFAVTRAALFRLRVSLPPVTPFIYYVGPAWPAPGFLLGLAMVLFSLRYPSIFLSGIGLNLMLGFGSLLLLQGLAVLYYVLTRFGIAKWVRMFLLAALFIFPLALQVLPWIGLGDSLMDWRRIRIER